MYEPPTRQEHPCCIQPWVPGRATVPPPPLPSSKMQEGLPPGMQEHLLFVPIDSHRRSTWGGIIILTCCLHITRRTCRCAYPENDMQVEVRRICRSYGLYLELGCALVIVVERLSSGRSRFGMWDLSVWSRQFWCIDLASPRFLLYIVCSVQRYEQDEVASISAPK